MLGTGCTTNKAVLALTRRTVYQGLSKQLVSEFEAYSSKGLYPVGVGEQNFRELTQVAGCKVAEGREGPEAGRQTRKPPKKEQGGSELEQ